MSTDKNKDGRITAIWPGSGLHFQEVVREPRWEDYNIRYMNPVRTALAFKHSKMLFFLLH